MDKPTILVEMDMKEEVTEVINKYVGLIPAMHIVMTLENVIKELNVIASQQIESARRQYEESKKGESSNDSE